MAQSPDINEPAFVASRCAAGANVQAVLDRPDAIRLLVDGAVEISARASGREARRLAIDLPGTAIAPTPQAGATTVIECVALWDAVILSLRPGILASDADDALSPMAQATSCRQIGHLVENARLAKAALAQRMRAFEERTDIEQLLALFISAFVGVAPHDFVAAIERSMALLSIERRDLVVVESAKDAAVADAINRLARSLDLNDVAEGIERDNQNALMDDLGCDMSQGFLLCKPLSCDGFRRWLDALADGGRALPHGKQKAASNRSRGEPRAFKDIH